MEGRKKTTKAAQMTKKEAGDDAAAAQIVCPHCSTSLKSKQGLGMHRLSC